MNGETMAASVVSRGHFQGHIVASAYSSDIDIVHISAESDHLSFDCMLHDRYRLEPRDRARRVDASR